jgi:putative spermidine/putrescine transport system ATP-binding protein
VKLSGVGAFEGSVGREVKVALRPEMVKLGLGPGNCNTLSGTVNDISFLGSIVRMRVGVGATGSTNPDSTVVLDEFNEPTLKLPQLGETVTINFPIEGPLVLDAKAPVESVEALIAEA